MVAFFPLFSFFSFFLAALFLVFSPFFFSPFGGGEGGGGNHRASAACIPVSLFSFFPLYFPFHHFPLLLLYIYIFPLSLSFYFNLIFIFFFLLLFTSSCPSPCSPLLGSRRNAERRRLRLPRAPGPLIGAAASAGAAAAPLKRQQPPPPHRGHPPCHPVPAPRTFRRSRQCSAASPGSIPWTPLGRETEARTAPARPHQNSPRDFGGL